MSLDQSRLGVLEAEFDQVVQGRTAAVGDSKAGVGNGVSPRTWRDETLGERERRFRELLEAFHAAVYTTDAAGRITFYNQAAAELWGHRPEWGKACHRAGINDVTFHDLRGTAVTRLAKAGCSVAEIASLTGHALKDAQAILDAHYLGGRLELAEAAMAKLEGKEGRTQTVKTECKTGLGFSACS